MLLHVPAHSTTHGNFDACYCISGRAVASKPDAAGGYDVTAVHLQAALDEMLAAAAAATTRVGGPAFSLATYSYQDIVTGAGRCQLLNYEGMPSVVPKIAEASLGIAWLVQSTATASESCLSVQYNTKNKVRCTPSNKKSVSIESFESTK